MSEPVGDGQCLSGVAVVDLTTTLSAAVAARLLAEAGADVVRVEQPGGDELRAAAPVGAASWNRSKRVVALDLAGGSDRGQLDMLLRRADVLVHDLTPARAAEHGLDAAALAAGFPHLVVGTVTGWPAWHPRAEDPAEEILVQAASGVMDDQQGNREGPIFTRMPFASWCAAFLLTGGIAARLVQRARTGVVGNVATSLFQGVLVPAALYRQRSDRLPAVIEQPHTLPKVWPGASLSLFECADGVWLQLAGSLGGWVESAPVLEQLALADAVDLSESGVTLVNLPRWQAIFCRQDSDTWFAAFNEVDVPCMLVRDLGACFTDEQVRANDYVVEVDDPELGRTVQAAAPFTLTPPCRVTGPAGARRLTAVTDFGHDDAAGGPRATAASAAPLDGITVLDFGSMIASPFGAQCLADFGARVVKVERLDGDRGRTLTQFGGANRHKQSLAIDLKHPDAAEPLRRLIAAADVVVHNIRAGAARRLGLDEASLRAANPRVVFGHVSANGGRGPMSGYPGYDPTAQALTGWERMNVGDGQDPMWMRNSVLDVGGGLASFVGTLLQLYRRETTGLAGSAGSSLLATGLTIASETALGPDGTAYRTAQVDPEQTGTGPDHRIYRTRTGWVAVAARTDAQRRALRGIAGVPLGDGLAGLDAGEALARLAAAGVPAAPVREDQTAEFFDDALHRRNGVARRLDAADYGSIEVVGGFWTIDGTATATKESIPACGEHSAEVLAGVGYGAAELQRLAAAGVLASPA
ncbi:Crotonobetainyl-CoA:carnitine CoA-transferase CaiB [Jatrophihabitans endophyticus]|uniref:Crotonobetainyl-CoA:carnitine CoA-transferase CaiB n=1 Tax=Jatrophihabitans endophyticus TaxID=1206085 RepID=A0A1M5PSB1_9ACTN|nr:CoA transferase [Jatrophihabitans endophyticus]SHH04735.1 Crotonobetainyl-CoA:carnitine CoA-transferase CaiB [Jatrophihabitans endophyticus]